MMEQQDFQDNLLISIFCDIDDFCKEFDKYHKEHLIGDETNKDWKPRCSMGASEIMTIIIMFHLSCFRNFKGYYKNYISVHKASYFSKLLSYNRFVEIMKEMIVPMTMYLITFKVGNCSGISFIDSTTLKACQRLY
ncbi:hypothetical protein AGMMS50222_10580 [Endomicrobiia bacterium]|nr:hypothetical protein AGMMS50222_10580 [Endomicrobiia bacterium]